jgi:hypothetical protein
LVADTVPTQIRNPKRTTAKRKPRPEIKVIGLRERVRTLEKVVVWSEEAFFGEGKRQHTRIKKLEQENLLLRADIAEMKRAFALGLARKNK